ncbi:MAG: amidophosphoribosyltransferase, partial [Pseudobdellovibrionaceae bacterium]
MAFKEECGVFGIWNHEHAARLTFLGLYALQHRGQEAAGIVCFDTVQRYEHKGLGLVSEIFTDENIAHLPGRQGIGHVRYSTTGQNSIKNAQPLTAQLRLGEIALAHNGNIVNYAQLSQKLQASGAALFASTDSEIFLHLLSREDQTDLGKGFLNVCSQVEGAFSLVVLTNKCLVAIRDPHGFRPLVLGYVTNDRGEKSPVVTSETCALDLIGAEFAREIAPGEIFVVTEEGERSYFLPKKDRLAHCIFEHVYFARPDSVVFGKSVYLARKKMGAELAKESPVDADLVIPVPDSGIPSALGFSGQSKIPFELGIIRNQYVGRTFLQPLQSMRDYGVKIKLNPQ